MSMLSAFFKNCCKLKKDEYLARAADDIRKTTNPDCKVFWSTLKRHRKKESVNENIPPYQWFHYFKDLFSCKEGGFLSDFDKSVYDFVASHKCRNCEDYCFSDDILSSPIADEEVVKSINQLKWHKSAGRDGIPPSFYKSALSPLVLYLKDLFNAVFDNGQFPSICNIGMIVPLFKSGNVSDPRITVEYLS